MRYALIGLALLAAGCSENPYSPTAATPLPPPPASRPQNTDNLTGTWSGSMTVTFQGQRGTVRTHTELQHDAGLIGGLWFISTPGNDARGKITGQTWFENGRLEFRGIVTWESSAQGGGLCRGETGLSGPVFDREIMLRAPTIDFGTTCGHAVSDISWVMTR